MLDIELGGGHGRLRDNELRIHVTDVLLTFVVLALADHGVTHQLLAALEIGSRKGRRGFGGLQIALGAIERSLERSWIDGEERLILKESDILGVIEGKARAKAKAARSPCCSPTYAASPRYPNRARRRKWSACSTVISADKWK